MPNIYYNPSSYDANTGAGYGRLTPRFHKQMKLGAEVWPYREEDDAYDDLDEDELDHFVKNINKGKIRKKVGTYYRTDPSNRADRSSLGTNHRGDLKVTESMPGTRRGISPMSSKNLYPKGFSGPPLGTGGAGQAFRTTGSYKRTGTQYGTSRAPLPIAGEDDDLKLYHLNDIPDVDELSLLKKRLKLLKLRAQNQRLK